MTFPRYLFLAALVSMWATPLNPALAEDFPAPPEEVPTEPPAPKAPEAPEAPQSPDGPDDPKRPPQDSLDPQGGPAAGIAPAPRPGTGSGRRYPGRRGADASPYRPRSPRGGRYRPYRPSIPAREPPPTSTWGEAQLKQRKPGAWHLAVGMGGATMWANFENRADPEGLGGFAMMIRGGFLLTPRIVLAVEGSFFGNEGKNVEQLTTSAHVHAMALLFLSRYRDIHIRAGLGSGFWHQEDSTGGLISERLGPSFKWGIGWDFTLSRRIKLGLDVAHQGMTYEGDWFHELSLMVTLSRY